MYNIIITYAEQQGHEDEEKENFWNELAEVTDKGIVLTGDLNGNVDTEREYETWHEGKTIGQRNEEGKMILNMLRAIDLTLANKFFTESLEQTYTYKSGQNRTVIDYITISRDILDNVVNCKVIPSKPVATKPTCNGLGDKQEKKKTCSQRINWWNLKTDKGKEIGQELPEFMVRDYGKEELTWDSTYRQIIETAKEVLGESRLWTYMEKKFGGRMKKQRKQ